VNTNEVHIPAKKIGKKPYFPERVEDQISRLYFDDGETAQSLADRYAPLTPTGTLSESAIRAIARRARKRITPAVHVGAGS
jgi:hypothetical protein